MRFRTEIEPLVSSFKLSHSTPVLMLGSCFTDEVGQRLVRDGFDVMHNPFGALYNPLSLSRCLDRALARRHYTVAELCSGQRGYHCLDYSTRYSGADAAAVVDAVNSTLDSVADMLDRQPVVFLTLGSAYVFERVDSGEVVGNCHKLPADFFRRRLITVDEAASALDKAVRALAACGVPRVVFTVSPIRHLSDGLHGNTLSKSTLHLAVERVCAMYPDTAAYFPAYEILMDDLRDYRFYASDMKHPSDVAVDYIYERFADTFFSADTRARAIEARKAFLASQHRPIL